MKIVVNGTCINGVESGAKNRFRIIYNYLISKNSNIHFYFLEPKDFRLDQIIQKKNNVTFIKTKCLSYFSFQRYIWSILSIPKIIKYIQPDVYEQSHLPLIKIPNVKIIFTIHDIRYSIKGLNLKSFFRPSILSNFFLIYALRNSDKIITVSQTVKEEINKIFQNNKTEVIYNPIKFAKNNNKEIEKKSQKNLNSKLLEKKIFFLSVGAFEKRKNYETIIYAAHLLKQMNFEFNFCLVGFQTSYLKELQNKIRELKLSQNMFLFHNISDDDLKYLYKKCFAFIYPSKYEGFGIPLIEAINFDCKIILSDIKVFKEISDGHGVYFNYESPEDLSHQIINCVSKELDNFKINKKVLDKYTLSNISNKIVELY